MGFLFQNNPNDLDPDPSYKMDLDLLDFFVREGYRLITKEIW